MTLSYSMRENRIRSFTNHLADGFVTNSFRINQTGPSYRSYLGKRLRRRSSTSHSRTGSGGILANAPRLYALVVLGSRINGERQMSLAYFGRASTTSSSFPLKLLLLK